MSLTYRHVAISFVSDTLGLATRLERAADSDTDWTVVDTVPNPVPANQTQIYDTPPAPGHWRYRLRSIRLDLSLSDPGPASRTSSPWSNQPTYNNSLTVSIVNLGTEITVSNLYLDSYYEYRLIRGSKAGYADGAAVDTAIGYQSQPLKDVPPKGTWYFWVERHYLQSYNSGAEVYRSVPVRMDFTGVPGITSLNSSTDGVTVSFPTLGSGDTLEIWKATEKPEETESYTRLGKVADTYTTYYTDAAVDSANAAFYHYRLRLIRNGESSDLGGYKSIYHDPKAPLRGGLLKAAAGSREE
jgi:hypothetical protein